MVSYGSHHDPQWACIQALETIKEFRENYLRSGMSFEMYADLIVAMKDKVSRLPVHYRATADKLMELAKELASEQ